MVIERKTPGGVGNNTNNRGIHLSFSPGSMSMKKHTHSNRTHSGVMDCYFYEDELGLVTIFENPVDNIPLADAGTMTYEEILDARLAPAYVSVREALALPKRKRNRLSKLWFASEYGAARRYMKEAGARC